MNTIAYDAALDACREIKMAVDPTRTIKDQAHHLHLANIAAGAALCATRFPCDWHLLVEMDPKDGPFGRRWVDCGEGPWKDPFDALLFADNSLTAYKLAGIIPEMSS